VFTRHGESPRLAVVNVWDLLRTSALSVDSTLLAENHTKYILNYGRNTSLHSESFVWITSEQISYSKSVPNTDHEPDLTLPYLVRKWLITLKPKRVVVEDCCDGLFRCKNQTGSSEFVFDECTVNIFAVQTAGKNYLTRLSLQDSVCVVCVL